jgi:hypothetical protein
LAAGGAASALEVVSSSDENAVATAMREGLSFIEGDPEGRVALLIGHSSRPL